MSSDWDRADARSQFFLKYSERICRFPLDKLPAVCIILYMNSCSYIHLFNYL